MLPRLITLIRIGITGAQGFLGWHLRAFLHARSNMLVILAGRSVMGDPQKLRHLVAGVDAIVHLAGANRGEDRTIRDTNIELAEKLVAACTAAGTKPHILFANSTHYTRPTAYGESKRIAAEKLAAHAAKAQATFTNLVMPHVFGEGCRPHYNSAVATFCHQLANDGVPRIIQDGELELIHAQRLSEQIAAIVERREGGEIRLHGVPIRVSAVLSALQRMAQQYETQRMPELASPFELDLFNTFRWYLFPQHYPVDLSNEKHNSLHEAFNKLRDGQCEAFTIQPACTRGNHYHRRTLKRLTVTKGEALIRIRRLLHSDIKEFRISADKPQFVDIPTLHVHGIVNIGRTRLMALEWTHEIFDATNLDLYSENV